MRVLHAIHDFLPRHRAGSEIYAFNLCRELAGRHHVTILCADHDPHQRHGHVTWRVHEDLPVVEIINNWRGRSFRETYRPSVIGDRIDHVLRATQPDVVHVHNLLNLSFDLPALARRRGAKVVATLHDYTLLCPSGGQRIHVAEQHLCREIDTHRCVRCFRESPFGARMTFGQLTTDTGMSPIFDIAKALVRRFPRTVGRLASRAGRMPTAALSPADVDERLSAARSVLEEVDVIVAPSPSIAAEFMRFGVADTKIRTMDYGFVPLIRQHPTRSEGPVRFGYIGTLVWHKGVHRLLEAVRSLPSNGYELKIFGDMTVFPDYAAQLRLLARGLPVEFMGKFDQRNVSDVYRQFDVLVVPSLWLENSPLVIHEAFMAGVPVVGASIGGIADLIEHERTGLLYDPQSMDALETALRALTADRTILHQLRAGVHTRTPVRSIAEDADAWDAIYREVRI